LFVWGLFVFVVAVVFAIRIVCGSVGFVTRLV
jgi:hypothetical protein